MHPISFVQRVIRWFNFQGETWIAIPDSLRGRIFGLAPTTPGGKLLAIEAMLGISGFDGGLDFLELEPTPSGEAVGFRIDRQSWQLETIRPNCEYILPRLYGGNLWVDYYICIRESGKYQRLDVVILKARHWNGATWQPI